MDKIEKRYHDGSYLAENPDWDSGDSPWKAGLVRNVLMEANISPESVCEVGCGSGEVLVNLKKYYPVCKFTGYDISPQAAQFWKRHKGSDVDFHLGDFLELNDSKYQVLLLLDVIEHLANPFSFLQGLLGSSKYYVFHIPLDLSALSVLRERPLMDVRAKVGHIHYYTKNLALALLQECGYRVISWKYTGAALHSPGQKLKTRIALLPRMLLYAIHKDVGVRTLGGETLVVLAEMSN